MKKIYIVIMLCVLGGLKGLQAQELLNYPLDTINGEEVYKYRVEKSIGLYRIGVNFNVAQKDIIRLNPQLRERGLHFDELLYIPTGRKVEPKKAEPERPVMAELKPVVEEPKVEEVPVAPNATIPEIPETPEIPEMPDTTVVMADTLPQPEILDTIVNGRRVIEYALLLPFESQQTKRSATAARMMEFYQVALFALPGKICGKISEKNQNFVIFGLLFLNLTATFAEVYLTKL